MNTDERWMAYALALGRRNLGATAENPAVGCAIVRNGALVGAGWTSRGGRPHGEVNALKMADDDAHGATAYVTLEPCNHQGQTPPCTGALIKAGIARVVIACTDPDVRVAGQGLKALTDAGVSVETGVLENSARQDLCGFLQRKTLGRPHIMLKLAVSADGKIAAERGKPTQITGPQVKARVHLMRAETDAILVGVSTVKADDPDLTCRLPGMSDRSPVRVVSDTRLSIPLTSKLVKSAKQIPVWILTCSTADERAAEVLREAGVTLVYCAATPQGKVDLHDAMLRLGGRGISRVMAEGGAHMAQALLQADLIDEVNLFSAPGKLGPKGLDALAGTDLRNITASVRFCQGNKEKLGADTLSAYHRTAKEKAMFTGLVTDIGEIVSIQRGGSVRMEIACNYDVETIAIGASIACSGVCLTVVETHNNKDGRTVFAVDVSPETVDKTSLGKWGQGTKVNLERAMKLGDEIGGHLVLGHVDGCAEIVSVTAAGDSNVYRFRAPDELSRFIASKGSIALDGTSLTVNDVEASEFTVNIIPHTQSVTTWGELAKGDIVNIEIDMLARYVARLADVKA